MRGAPDFVANLAKAGKGNAMRLPLGEADHGNQSKKTEISATIFRR
jgi:hypothetical protein